MLRARFAVGASLLLAGLAKLPASLALAEDAPPEVVAWTVKPDPGTPLPKCTGSVHLPDESDVHFIVPPRPSSCFAGIKSVAGGDIVETFNASSGEVRTKVAKIDAIREPVFDPAGDYLAGMTQDSTHDAEVWSIKEQRKMCNFQVLEQGGTWHVVDFPTPATVLIYTEGDTGNLRIFDIASGHLLKTISVTGPAQKAGALVSPGGKYAVVANDRILNFYDLTTGAHAGRIDLPVHDVFRQEGCAIAFSPDGNELAHIDPNVEQRPLMRVIDLRSGKPTSSEVIYLTSFEAIANMPVAWEMMSSQPRMLQWLADGSGWVLGHECIIDRVSGKGIFEFPKSMYIRQYPVMVLSGDQILFAFNRQDRSNRYAQLYKQTVENLTLPKDLGTTVASIRAGGDVQDSLLPPLSHPVMSSTRDVVAMVASGAPPIEPLASAPPSMPAPHTLALLGTFAGEHPFVFAGPAAQQVDVTKSYRLNSTPLDGRQLTTIDAYSFAGRRLGSANFSAECELMDASPDGTEFLVGYRRPTGDRIDVCSVAGKGKPITSWIPYPTVRVASGQLPETDRILRVSGAQFIDNDRVVTQQEGELTVWQVTGCKPVYRAKLAGEHLASLTNNRGFLAVPSADHKKIGFFEAATGVQHGVLALQAAPSTGQSIRFSPDGRTALVASDESGSPTLWKYDLITGAGTRVLAAPGPKIEIAGWIKPPYVLAGQWLLNADTGKVLAKVTLPPWTQCRVIGFQNRLWVVSKQDLRGASLLVPMEFPDAAAMAKLTDAAVSPEQQEYALKSGGSVSLSIQIPGASAEQLTGVTEKLAARLKTLGITVAEGSPVQLSLSFAAGEVKEDRIPLLDEHLFNGTMSFTSGGQALWQSTWTISSTPPMFVWSTRDGVQEKVAEFYAGDMIGSIPVDSIPGLVPNAWSGPTLEIPAPASVAELLDPARNDPKQPPQPPVAPVPDKSTRTVAAASEARERAELRALKPMVTAITDVRSAVDELSAGVVTKKITQAQFTDALTRLERVANALPPAPKNLLPETTESVKTLKAATLSSVDDYRVVLQSLKQNTDPTGADSAIEDAVNLYRTQIGPETDFLRQRLAELQAKYP